MSGASGYGTAAAHERRRLFATRAPGWSILVRLLVGLVVFLPEGIQKLEYPDLLGAGRFAHIGIPYPDLMGPFVGLVEIVCGALIIVGIFTRFAAIPLLIIMWSLSLRPRFRFCWVVTCGFFTCLNCRATASGALLIKSARTCACCSVPFTC